MRLRAFGPDETRILRALSRDLAPVGTRRLICDPQSGTCVLIERTRESLFTLTRLIETGKGRKAVEELVYCINRLGQFFPVDHLTLGPNGQALPRPEEAHGEQGALAVHLAHHLAAGTLLRVIEREQGAILRAYEPGGTPPATLEPFEG